MSVRYGIVLTPDPTFTARAYQARQIICGQYGMWAAEMLPIYIYLTGFFPCHEGEVSDILNRLGNITRQDRGSRELHHRGVNTFPDLDTTIFLDFSPTMNDGRGRWLGELHNRVIDLLKNTLKDTGGAEPDAGSTKEDYHPHLPLMRNAKLKPAVFQSAVEFAREVVGQIGLPSEANGRSIEMMRFESDMAGDTWEPDQWEKDIRWSVLDSFPL